MRTLLDQLDRSLGGELYYISLIGALAIPDIAGALDSENGEAEGPKYIAWFDRWVRPRSRERMQAMLPPDIAALASSIEDSPLDGDACYRFRCSLLHQGSSQHPKSPFTRIIFIEPGSTTTKIHNSILNGALCIDLRWFCADVTRGARLWLDAVENTPHFKRNYDRFASRHPSGLAPYITGIPVIG